MSRTVDDLKRKVKEIVELRGAATKTKDGLPGKDWVSAFKGRHPDLSLRKPQALGKERALVDPDLLEKWFSGMKKHLDSQDPSLLLSADIKFNADETGLPKVGKCWPLQGVKIFTP